MTFAVVARCECTGMFGVAVSSSSPAVAARCAHAKAGVGAASSQNVTDPRLGVKALELMKLGASAAQALDIITSGAEHIEHRQLLAVDGNGGSATYSGSRSLGVYAEATGKGVACAGNLLANPEVPSAMVDAFNTSKGDLGDRLIAVMQAGLAAGGEAGPVRSAGMRLVRDVPWPVADLRIDWTEACPIAALTEVWAVYRPQLDDYVTRALNPDQAPGYGVPGDEG